MLYDLSHQPLLVQTNAPSATRRIGISGSHLLSKQHICRAQSMEVLCCLRRARLAFLEGANTVKNGKAKVRLLQGSLTSTIILETAVGLSKEMQDFESESVAEGTDHS